MYRLYFVTGFVFALTFLLSCQGLQQTSQKGTIEEGIRRVTPNDVKAFTQRIITDEYQFEMNRTDETQSSLYYETEWKNVELTPDEEEKGINDVRVRVKIRTQKLRRGMDEYSVHNLKFTADVQGVTPESSGNFVNLEITPQREDYISDIFSDYKTEFDAGVMDY